MSIINPEVVYAPSHEWAKIQGNEATVGISDFAQHALGSVVFVDLPSVGAKFKAGQEFGAVESVKAASELFLPLSGEVIAVNDELSDKPELLNNAPYGSWIVKIKLSHPEEAQKLLKPEEYAKIAK